MIKFKLAFKLQSQQYRKHENFERPTLERKLVKVYILCTRSYQLHLAFCALIEIHNFWRNQLKQALEDFCVGFRVQKNIIIVEGPYN